MENRETRQLNFYKARDKKRESFRIGFKQGILKRMMKVLFVYKWYHFRRKQVRMLFKDLRHFPEELVDYLMEVSPSSVSDAKSHIDDWLHLEAKVTGFEKVLYFPGKGREVFDLIKYRRMFWEMNNL